MFGFLPKAPNKGPKTPMKTAFPGGSRESVLPKSVFWERVSETVFQEPFLKRGFARGVFRNVFSKSVFWEPVFKTSFPEPLPESTSKKPPLKNQFPEDVSRNHFSETVFQNGPQKTFLANTFFQRPPKTRINTNETALFKRALAIFSDFLLTRGKFGRHAHI